MIATNDPKRRAAVRLLAAAGAASLAGLAPSVRAQSFPARPVTLVVPFPPGSATDAAVRAMALAAARPLGQQVVVENRPGAAGTMAAGNLAQSGNPDGYTIAVAPASLFRVPHISKVAYDPLKDLTYIMSFSGYSFALVVPGNSPWKTAQEFLAYAKANPGKVTVGTTGAGSSGHVAIHYLSQKSGADLAFVPFKGGAEVLQAFVGGHITAMLDGGWAQVEKQAGGRVLLICSESRVPRLPNVPTAKELGYDVVTNSPIGLVGPRGMDPKVVAVLHDAFKTSLADPAYRKALDTFDLADAYLTGDQYFALATKLFHDEKRNVEVLGLKPQ
ncbi:MAG TPA: tripartite tricarboxylate transporter substrate binding protein [Burkholderiaceae bacterium]|mgnify:CR=1 FL=1|nr:tripartite tricarboxylate transporter substrate binding protein [Burkholderiaceae bacterium]